MLFGVVLGPVYEELFFRGFLFPLLAENLRSRGRRGSERDSLRAAHGPQYQWAWQQMVCWWELPGLPSDS